MSALCFVWVAAMCASVACDGKRRRKAGRLAGNLYAIEPNVPGLPDCARAGPLQPGRFLTLMTAMNNHS